MRRASSGLILRTKLQMPVLKGKILYRARILSRMLEHRDRKLIAVCADAGYGKTTLLVQFCNELKAPFVYYTLDESDHDPATFFLYLLEGMRTISPRFGDRTQQALRQTNNFQIIAGTFINECLAMVKDDVYLVLDDHHYLGRSSQITRAIDFLLKNSPPVLHFVISSRSAAPVNIPWFQAKQDLLLVDRDALRFSAAEIRALLQEVYRLKIPDEDIVRIERHTEGWITGIQLILQKVRATGGARTRETLNGFIASGDELFHYFAGEVFEQLPSEVREFLIKTSVLDLVNADIGNYLLKSRTARSIIDFLDTVHVFIGRIGDHYRYHPLFRDFLVRRLKGTYTAPAIRRLNVELGNYFLRKGEYSSAVNHFLAAENYARAAKIIERHYHYWRITGNYASFIGLVRRFPETVTNRFPHLQLLAAKYLLYLGDNTEVVRIASRLVRLFTAARNHDGVAQAHYLTGYVHLLAMDQPRALAFLNRAYRMAGRIRPKTRLDILLARAIVYRLHDRYQESMANLVQAYLLARRIRDPECEINVLKNYAYLYWAMSDYRRADEVFNDLFARFGADSLPVDFGKTYTDAAFVALRNNNLEKSRQYLGRAEKIADQFNDQRTLMYCFFYRAELEKYLGENKKAIAHYEQVLEMNRELREQFIDHYCRLSLAAIYVRGGDVASARSMMATIEPRAMDLVSPQIAIDIMTMRGALNIAEGLFSAADEELKRARELAVKTGNQYQMMTVEYALARYHVRTGRDDAAAEHLARALHRARENHYDMYLIEEGRTDLGLIDLGLRRDCERDYLLHILSGINTDAARALLNRTQIRQGLFDLSCRFFGNMEVRDVRGRLITPRWRTRKGKALFVFLIVNRGQGCTRDQLIDNFWPDKNVREAAHSLQVEISSLRAILKELSQADRPADKIISYRSQRYFLDPLFLVRTDHQEFDELVKEAGASETADAVARYERALVLYRGDFCPEVTDAWCESIRLYYRDAVFRILGKLGHYHQDRKNHRAALDCWQRALTLNEFDEDVHLAIMRLYAALGDRPAVQRQYEKLVRKLAEAGITAVPPEAARLLHAARNP